MIRTPELVEALAGQIKPRFKLRRFDELKIGTERTYLVKGLIPRTGLVVAWGPPKCGKSFWTFDLAMHIALGREYRGRRVQRGPVVYCAFEARAVTAPGPKLSGSGIWPKITKRPISIYWTLKLI